MNAEDRQRLRAVVEAYERGELGGVVPPAGAGQVSAAAGRSVRAVRAQIVSAAGTATPFKYRWFEVCGAMGSSDESGIYGGYDATTSRDTGLGHAVNVAELTGSAPSATDYVPAGTHVTLYWCAKNGRWEFYHLAVGDDDPAAVGDDADDDDGSSWRYSREDHKHGLPLTANAGLMWTDPGGGADKTLGVKVKATAGLDLNADGLAFDPADMDGPGLEVAAGQLAVNVGDGLQLAGTPQEVQAKLMSPLAISGGSICLPLKAATMKVEATELTTNGLSDTIVIGAGDTITIVDGLVTNYVPA
jgi:hypothetical protein